MSENGAATHEPETRALELELTDDEQADLDRWVVENATAKAKLDTLLQRFLKKLGKRVKLPDGARVHVKDGSVYVLEAAAPDAAPGREAA